MVWGVVAPWVLLADVNLRNRLCGVQVFKILGQAGFLGATKARNCGPDSHAPPSVATHT